MKYQYRLGRLEDINEVMEVIEDGRQLLKEEGNGQWQFGYPAKSDLMADIKNNNLYCVIDDNKIVGVCAITGYEESYMHFYEGKWKSDYDYLVLHRIAVKSSYRGKGYGKALFDVFEQVAREKGIHSLRIDTHKNNSLLLHIMKSKGFEYCGKAILPPNKDRVMYEKII